MTTAEHLRSFRDLIQVDVGGRGLARDPVDNLLTACPDDFANACQSIADHPAPRVGIVTGFMIPTVEPPMGETDGPLGALFLARALFRLRISSVLLADGSAMAALAAGFQFRGRSVPLVELGRTADSVLIRRETGPLTHLIALERSGPSHATGRNHTMRGRDITDLTAPAHVLFEGPREYVTIGIGDGGNEIGMGKVAYGTIRKNIPNGEQVACRVATDHLIVAGVSNWGAYALAAGVMVLKGQPDPGLFDPADELRMLEHLVARGPLVDGVRGTRTATVDGLDWETYAKPIEAMREVLMASGTP